MSATGLSRSSLYNAFGGMEELYTAALQRYLDRTRAEVFDRTRPTQTGAATPAEVTASHNPPKPSMLWHFTSFLLSCA